MTEAQYQAWVDFLNSLRNLDRDAPGLVNPDALKALEKMVRKAASKRIESKLGEKHND